MAGHTWSELRTYTYAQLLWWTDRLTERLKAESDAIKAASKR